VDGTLFNVELFGVTSLDKVSDGDLFKLDPDFFGVAFLDGTLTVEPELFGALDGALFEGG